MTARKLKAGDLVRVVRILPPGPLLSALTRLRWEAFWLGQSAARVKRIYRDGSRLDHALIASDGTKACFQRSELRALPKRGKR